MSPTAEAPGGGPENGTIFWLAKEGGFGYHRNMPLGIASLGIVAKERIGDWFCSRFGCFV